MNDSLDSLPSREIDQFFLAADQSLRSKHPSMRDDLNPVLGALRRSCIGKTAVESILTEYSSLPACIAQFLSLGIERLRAWPRTATELTRNLGEELGSRTNDISHYQILKDCLMHELELNLDSPTPKEPTARFLQQVRTGLSFRSIPFTAGVLYGLEASAVPELTVVGHILNAYAALTNRVAPITWTQQEDASWFSNSSLNNFFVMHLYDFEVGHKDGLTSSLAADVRAKAEIEELSRGFEYLLDAMDQWWDSLASTTSDLDSTLSVIHAG